MRMPISRVRSVTLTSMMFMMPMPPTSNEIPATEPSNSVMIVEMEPTVSAISFWLRMLKSFSRPTGRLCRCRSRLVICSCAVAMRLAAESFHRRGLATKHDLVVSGALAGVLSGGDTDVTRTLREDDVLELERTQFMALLHHPDTMARIEHVLETGKPLRN